MRVEQLRKFKRQLNEIANKYGIKSISVFGSVARGESTTASDVDFLIEMDEGASALGVGGFQFEAERLLGEKVDVVPSFALRNGDNKFAKTIETQAEPL
jgi:hypothetical protein